MTHQGSISAIICWLEKRGYDVNFDRNGDDSVDREVRIVSIKNTRSDETQLHILLHECGHVLVLESDRVVNGIEEVLNKYADSSQIHKAFTVIEEVEAWKRGLALAKRLHIDIDKVKWNKDVSRAISAYMRWAVN